MSVVSVKITPIEETVVLVRKPAGKPPAPRNPVFILDAATYIVSLSWDLVMVPPHPGLDFRVAITVAAWVRSVSMDGRPESELQPVVHFHLGRESQAHPQSHPVGHGHVEIRDTPFRGPAWPVSGFGPPLSRSLPPNTAPSTSAAI